MTTDRPHLPIDPLSDPVGGQKRVTANAAIGTLAQFSTIAAGLVTMPLLLTSLGATMFGAYALVASMTAYFGILDLGIGASLTRFMAFYEQRGDRQKVGAFATFGLLFYLAMTLALLPAVWFAAPAIGRLLGLPPEVQADFPFWLVIMALLFIGWSLNGILVSRLAAVHRLDLSGYALIAGAAVFTVTVFVFVPQVRTIESVLACVAANLFTAILILAVANFRINGWLFASIGAIRGADIRELFSFSIWSQISTITSVINLEADKAIISRGIGVAQVTPYHMANRLALLSRMVPLQLLTALLPAITAKFSHGATPAEMRDSYVHASRTLMIPTLLIVGFVAGGADALLRFWLARELPDAAFMCVALVLSYAVNNATGPGTVILKAEGFPQLETFYGTVSAILNVGLTILLIGPLGLLGVVIATIIANVLGSALFIVLFHRRKAMPWWSTIGHWLSRLAAITLGAAFLLHIGLGQVAGDTTDRWQLLPILTVAGIAYVALFLALGKMLRIWIPSDRQLLVELGAMLRLGRKRAV